MFACFAMAEYVKSTGAHATAMVWNVAGIVFGFLDIVKTLTDKKQPPEA